MKAILVMTALEIERAAVETNLTNITTVFHPSTGTDYKKGTYHISDSRKIEVIIGRTDQTNPNAAMETERALEFFDPEYVFFVGVAGGLKDVTVGDIVIGTSVIGVERGKAEDHTFKARPQFGASSYVLERLAGDYASSDHWNILSNSLVNTEFSDKVKVVAGVIASGEKVDAGNESTFHKQLLEIASHAVAIEMEGLGFLEVCRTRPLVKSLLLRGISDMVKDKEAMDTKGSQPYASKNVSSFLFGLLERIDDEPQIVEKPRAQILEVMIKLYPGGLRDNGIWTNAGGNLALINLNQSAKGQWVEAIRTLMQGGGGNITPQSLLAAVLEDFQNNTDIKLLISKF